MNVQSVLDGQSVLDSSQSDVVVILTIHITPLGIRFRFGGSCIRKEGSPVRLGFNH